VPRRVPVRGVVEGFYGPPWPPDARLEMIDFLAEHDMNAYVYAPKNDPKHRDHWREPYDDGELAYFGTAAARASALGVRFGFAISPGLDIRYDDATDRDALLTKLTPLLDGGIDWIVLALDDINPRPGLAAEQADLATWLLDAASAVRGIAVTVVPTEYVGTRATPYLIDLAARLPTSIDVMWTGPTVCSPTITGADAGAWSEALGGRPPLVWDNYPVNDGPMERSLHLGPYRGRDPELSDAVAGVLCNPMLQPRASRVALATAAAFLNDPGRYEPDVEWERALIEVGETRARALVALASACADGPLLRSADLEAHRLVDAIEHADVRGRADALMAAREHFQAVKDAAHAWADAPDDALEQEVRPWLAQGRAEAKSGLAAVRLLEHLDGDDADAQNALLHVFAVLFSWDAARAGDRVVFGARFAIVPAVVQLSDGQPGLDIDLAVTEDDNAVDRVCRFALDAYTRWSKANR
jgi:hyaluronoglucosaminidase